MLFNLSDYRDYLLSIVRSKVYYKNQDITNTLIDALLIFDQPISKTISITKQTLYSKYKELFDLSKKPTGVYINLWLLEAYGYKYCKTCTSAKPLSNFGTDIHTTNGLNRVCKNCVNHTSNAWKKQNREIVNKAQKTYYYANIDIMREKSLEYQRTHKALVNAASAKKRATKLSATPRWLTDQQRKDIKHFYYASKQLELDTGTKYHVDHIIPLQGKTVCGLHVPWNLQVLPAIDNIRKSNKYFEDYNI